MDTLGKALRSVGREVQRDLLASAFVFPRTTSVADDGAAIEIEQPALDLDELVHHANAHPEAVALNAQRDLKLILEVCKLLKDELPLDKFDYIIFWRGGLSVLKVRLTANERGRSAYVEINDYRRRIEEARRRIEEAATLARPSWPAMFAVMALAAMVVVTVVAKKKVRLSP